MSRLAPNQMTVRQLEALKDGVHSDGGNLWLTVAGKGRTWSFRFKSPVSGKRREMGLGSYRDVGLAAARLLAADARELVRKHLDPIDERNRNESARRRDEVRTFEAVAALFIAEKAPGWRDPRSKPIWTSTLTRAAYPIIGQKPIAAIGTDDVLAVLRPIWRTTNETADRVRGRIERILDYARTQGWREGENPARWRGHLAHILPKPSDVQKVEHHPAAAAADIAAVMAALAAAGTKGAQAVRFACLTAARSGEVRGAPWSEFDLQARLWTIPAERMKAKRPHRVPLTDPAIAILEVLPRATRGPDDIVFEGGRAGRPLSDVALTKALHLAAGSKAVSVHGLRSTFRDWASETTDHTREVAEMALAHAIGDKTEAAYRRGDLFQKRRRLMEDWAAFCCPTAPATTSAPVEEPVE